MADRNDDRKAPTAPRAPAGLNVPLPAVLVGLGVLAASPATQATVVARPDYFATPANVQLTDASIVANDTIILSAVGIASNFLPINTTATLEIISPPLHGNVIVDAIYGSPTFGRIRYSPKPGFVGQDKFTYALLEIGSGTPSNLTSALGGLQPLPGEIVDSSNAVVTIDVAPPAVPALAPAALAGLSGLVALAGLARRRKNRT